MSIRLFWNLLIVIVIVAVMVPIMITVAPIQYVVHRPFIAATKSFAIVFARTSFDVGMPVFFTVVHVGSAMLVVVPACTFDSIVIALALHFAKFGGWNVPTTSILVIARWRRWCFLGLRNHKTGRA